MFNSPVIYFSVYVCVCVCYKIYRGNSLGVQWLELGTSAKSLVQSLVGEVRSSKHHGTAKNQPVNSIN